MEAASVVGYVRCSTEEQATTGLSLQAQRQAIAVEVSRRNWDFHSYASDTISTRARLSARPGLSAAFEVLGKGEASVLLVSRLDRLARSVLDFATILEKADTEGWQVVVMDPAVDMTTPYGKAMAGMAAVFAQLERDLISQRTKEGLAAKMATGWIPGSPKARAGLKPEAKRRIEELAALGHKPVFIAAQLDFEGFKPPFTSDWRFRTVSRYLGEVRAGTRPSALG